MRDLCRRPWPRSPWAALEQRGGATVAHGAPGLALPRAARARARAGPAALWRTAPRRDAVTLVVCWALGYGLAVLTWVAPDLVAWAGAHVPGAAVLRDGSRLLVLCAPLLAPLAAAAPDRLPDLFEDGAVRVMVAGALVLLPVLLLMSDAAWGLRGQLRPVDLPADYAAARRVIRPPPRGRPRPPAVQLPGAVLEPRAEGARPGRAVPAAGLRGQRRADRVRHQSCR